jgi:hypothetical protein
MKLRPFFHFIFLSLVASQLANGQVRVENWNGITLLKSNKAEVERILGKSATGRHETVREVVVPWYSAGFCKNAKNGAWNMPKGTVTGILVSQKLSLPISDHVGSNLKDFEKFPVPKFKERFLYLNRDKSLEIETQIKDGVEEVIYTVYRPGSGHDVLRCKNNGLLL